MGMTDLPFSMGVPLGLNSSLLHQVLYKGAM